MKPMLAATVDDISKLRYPLLASPKLDGIRAMVIDGVLVSRSLKPIPNKHLQGLFGRPWMEGMDGELIVGSSSDPSVFRNTTSAVMSTEGKPKVCFFAFDNFSFPEKAFKIRLESVKASLFGFSLFTHPLNHSLIHNEDQLLRAENHWLSLGYEGVMLRDPDGVYKFGRSTLRERGLMKLKRFSDAEAVILGFEEQLQNTNEAKRDKLNRIERSNHKSGMVGKGTLGSLRVSGINGTYENVEFNVGSGFDDNLRDLIWSSKNSYLGRIIKFKYFPTGSKDAPRFPTFLGFRED